MFTRRLVMQGMAGLVAAAAARPAVAASASPRKMIFVFANGGWDPLTVFAPIFDSPHVDGNDGGEPATVGGIRFVDHATRPAVRSFFERWHDRTVILNGISVPSLSHEVCTRLVWTGQVGEGRPDWPSTVGAGAAAAFTLPSLVLSGPSYPDVYGVYSARAGANGQLADLVDGAILERPDPHLADHPLPATLSTLVQRRVTQRAAAFAGTADPLAAAFQASLERAAALTGAEPLDFRSAESFVQRTELAVQALERGVSRAVTLETDPSWDTHTSNDVSQGFYFEALFDGLSSLVDELARAPGSSGSLLDETTIVVLSEMGRTPRFNGADGRDHWPYTSAMILGAGVRGDQVISGYDDGYLGLGYDPATGARTDGGPLTPEHVGATLLAIADLDPGDHLPADISPIAAVVA